MNIAAAMLIGCSMVESATAIDPSAPVSAIAVQVSNIHDADTLTGTLLMPWGVSLRDRSIRAYGYDAWEINRTRQTVEVTDREISKGKVARDALAELIAGGQLFVEDSGETDPYGRISAVLWVRSREGTWIYVARWMEERGHLRVKRPRSN